MSTTALSLSKRHKKLTPAQEIRLRLLSKGVKAHEEKMKKIGAVLVEVFKGKDIEKERKTAWKS